MKMATLSAQVREAAARNKRRELKEQAARSRNFKKLGNKFARIAISLVKAVTDVTICINGDKDIDAEIKWTVKVDFPATIGEIQDMKEFKDLDRIATKLNFRLDKHFFNGGVH